MNLFRIKYSKIRKLIGLIVLLLIIMQCAITRIPSIVIKGNDSKYYRVSGLMVKIVDEKGEHFD